MKKTGLALFGQALLERLPDEGQDALRNMHDTILHAGSVDGWFVERVGKVPRGSCLEVQILLPAPFAFRTAQPGLNDNLSSPAGILDGEGHFKAVIKLAVDEARIMLRLHVGNSQ